MDRLAWQKRLSALLSLVALGALPAREAHAGPQLSVAEPGRAIELFPKGNNHEGSFVLENRGDAPAQVRARAVTTEGDVRLPPGLSALMEGKGERATLAPGAKQRVTLRWAPGSGRARELYGQVAVELEGGAPGAPPTAGVTVAVHAEQSRGLFAPIARHGLSALWALPLLGALLVLAARVLRRDDRAAWIIAASASGAQLLVLGVLSLFFDAGFGRAEGNDGLQLIERGPLAGGVEYFVGVDGASWSLLVLTAAVGLAGAVAGRRLEMGKRPFFASYLASLGFFTAAFVAVDMALFTLAWAGALGSLALLAASVPGHRRSASAVRLGVLAAGSTLALACALVPLSSHVGRVVLSDGSIAERSFAITSLVRGAFTGGPTLLGLPLAAGAFVLLFAACAPLLPLYPLQGWLAGLADGAPAPARMIAAALPPSLGLYALVRIGLFVLPEGALWAQPALSWVGAAGLLLAGLSALGEGDLRGLVARACSAQGALALLGLASATPQGVAGALALAFAHGLGAALLAGASGALSDRVRTAEADRLGGLGAEAPLLGASLGVALLASCSAPGTAGFWGAFLALTGALPSFGPQSVLGLAGLLALGASHVRLGQKALLGKVPEGWRKSAYLEPFGGRFPDLSRHERWSLLPLLALALLLGLYPRPVLAPIERASLDAASFVSPPGPSQIASR